jgi:aryl-alcohol dehydrogenase-like predicted oxidoreductase
MLEKKAVGSTGIAVSPIGLGTVKFGRNEKVHYPQSFALPTDQQILTLLAHARDLGINLLDTAPAYGSSEERLGKLLKNQRAQWILATKVGEEFIEGVSHYDFSADYIQKSIERSLTRLHTDYLDFVLIHSNGDDEKILAAGAAFATLNELKQSGKIRAFGMSTKTVAGGLQTVDQADIVMVTHNPVYTEERSVIAHAQQLQKGVFIKKALASGHLQKITANGVATTDPVQAAMNFIFQEPGVSSIILGTLNPEHLTHNVHCAALALVKR